MVAGRANRANNSVAAAANLFFSKYFFIIVLAPRYPLSRVEREGTPCGDLGVGVIYMALHSLIIGWYVVVAYCFT